MENKGSKTQTTEIYNLIILDKSGSMCSIADAAIAGFNETVGSIRSAQKLYKETQKHFVSLLPFCGCSMDYVYEATPVAEVKNLTSRSYQPCCSTPLYDAMGHGINDLLKRTQDKPNASVIVTIITDGMENASREYSGAAIKALVDKMRDQYGWNFAYIGTNQDVESVAINLSIHNTMYFEDTHAGMVEAWEKERKSRNRMFSRMNTVCCEMPDDNMEGVREMLRKNVNYVDVENYSHRVTPDKISRLKKNQVFVFGSNAQGLHNGGAAAVAVKHFGAVKGQAEGLQGQSYALVSTEGTEVLAAQVREFVAFAKAHPELTFLTTRIGCGNAGNAVKEVASLFVGAVDVENIWLPKEFWAELI